MQSTTHDLERDGAEPARDLGHSRPTSRKAPTTWAPRSSPALQRWQRRAPRMTSATRASSRPPPTFGKRRAPSTSDTLTVLTSLPCPRRCPLLSCSSVGVVCLHRRLPVAFRAHACSFTTAAVWSCGAGATTTLTHHPRETSDAVDDGRRRLTRIDAFSRLDLRPGESGAHLVTGRTKKKPG